MIFDRILSGGIILSSTGSPNSPPSIGSMCGHFSGQVLLKSTQNKHQRLLFCPAVRYQRSVNTGLRPMEFDSTDPFTEWASWARAH